jgi:microcin C transport system permease protein
MRDYFIRRFLLIPPTLLGVTMIVFLITRFVPGGPMEQVLAEMRQASDGAGGGGIGGEMALTEDMLEQLRARYGFDKPWYTAYWIWLKDVCTGDFGTSFRYHEPVWDVIKERLPVSIYYGLVTLVLTYLISIPLGIYKAVRHNKLADSVSSVFVFTGYAVPNYVLGALLLVFAAAKTGWFPMGGFMSYDFEDKTLMGKAWDIVHHSVLPLCCYLVGSFAFVTFLMKNHLMDNLAADYVRTAVAKGVSFKDAVRKHAFRNSLIPIATNLGHQITFLIAGSFLIETIFDIDGFGLIGFNSVVDRDYPVVMGVLLLTALLTLLGNILSDVMVALVDPRVRFN